MCVRFLAGFCLPNLYILSDVYLFIKSIFVYQFCICLSILFLLSILFFIKSIFFINSIFFIKSIFVHEIYICLSDVYLFIKSILMYEIRLFVLNLESVYNIVVGKILRYVFFID